MKSSKEDSNKLSGIKNATKLIKKQRKMMDKNLISNLFLLDTYTQIVQPSANPSSFDYVCT